MRRRLAASFAMFLLIFVVSAQNELPTNTIIEGSDEQRWSFNALRDEVYSFIVRGEGDFDPVVTLESSTGVLITNDDYIYPDSRDALLEAVTIPATGNYDVVVNGYGDASGNYTLTMLPGYADKVLDETFQSLTDWEGEALNAELGNDALVLSLEGIQQNATYINTEIDDLGVYFAQVNVTDITSRNTWRVGMTLQQQANGDHYFFEINQRGQWRFTVFENNGERFVRDWAVHPAIVAGEISFKLGVLANQNHFEVFYNGQLLGSVSDEALNSSGNIGLGLITADALDSAVTATFDDFIITAPLGASGERVFPQHIVDTNAAITVQELERRGVIPTGGRQVLNVAESFLESRSPGVDVLALGRGATFRNFVISTTASLQQPNGDGVTGCGLVVRNLSDTDYMVAYLDSAGGYGVSQRMDDGFEAGIYGESSDLDLTDPNRLLLVINEDMLHYYINGVYVDSMTIDPLEGQIGNSVVNFDPVEALCRFTDTWLWTWD